MGTAPKLPTHAATVEARYEQDPQRIFDETTVSRTISKGTHSIARSNLFRELKYRPHVKWAYWGTSAISVVATLAAVVWFMGPFVGIPRQHGIVGFIGLLVVGLGQGFWAFGRLRRIVGAEILIKFDRLTITQNGAQSVIPYNEIRRVILIGIPFFESGFVIEMNSRERYLFTASLERSEYVLDGIVGVRPELVENQSMLEYRRTAILRDHAYQRSYDRLKKRGEILTKYIFVPFFILGLGATPVLLGTVLPSLPLPVAVLGALCFVCNFLCAQIGRSLEEMFIRKSMMERLTLDPTAVRRDHALEVRLQKYSHIVYGLLTAIWTIAAIMWVWN